MADGCLGSVILYKLEGEPLRLALSNEKAYLVLVWLPHFPSPLPTVTSYSANHTRVRASCLVLIGLALDRSAEMTSHIRPLITFDLLDCGRGVGHVKYVLVWFPSPSLVRVRSPRASPVRRWVDSNFQLYEYTWDSFCVTMLG